MMCPLAFLAVGCCCHYHYHRHYHNGHVMCLQTFLLISSAPSSSYCIMSSSYRCNNRCVLSGLAGFPVHSPILRFTQHHCCPEQCIIRNQSNVILINTIFVLTTIICINIIKSSSSLVISSLTLSIVMSQLCAVHWCTNHHGVC